MFSSSSRRRGMTGRYRWKVGSLRFESQSESEHVRMNRIESIDFFSFRKEIVKLELFERGDVV